MKSHGFLVQPGVNVKLNECNPAYIANKKDKESVESELSHYSSRMSELQYKLFADKSQSLLIILQGIDASGKDGTIRHVMGAFNPQSCRVESFKEPSTEDLSHDYLWRIHRLIPSKGDVSVFNRSHYGDVIEVRVHNLLPKSEWPKRYRQINEFERYLSENHIKIIKFFLHISKEEQKKRLQNRLNDPSKNWKISESDLNERKYWDEYMKAYEEALSRCSTGWAPWYIIPANTKWFRNLCVAKIVTETFESMNLHYPKPKTDVSKLVFD